MTPNNLDHPIKVRAHRQFRGQDCQQVHHQDLERQHIAAQLDLGLGRRITHFSCSVGLVGSPMESRVGGGGQTASADEGADVRDYFRGVLAGVAASLGLSYEDLADEGVAP